jgi:NitT/TauT family transport system permease protein
MAAVAAEHQRSLRLASPRLVRGLVGVAILFAILEGLTRAALVNPRYLPPASAVVAATARILVDLEFLGDVAATLAAWAVGLAIAIVVAVPLGLVLGSSRRSYAAAAAAIDFLRPIPSVALIPLAILVFGRGLDMKVALIVYASSWPILFNAIYGVRQVDPVATETARVFGFGRVAVLWRTILPSALPFISTGIRVAAAIALILAISAELIAGGSSGIGTWMLLQSQAGSRREEVYAGIVVAGMLGLAINAALVAIERRLFFWHPRLRSTA